MEHPPKKLSDRVLRPLLRGLGCGRAQLAHEMLSGGGANPIRLWFLHLENAPLSAPAAQAGGHSQCCLKGRMRLPSFLPKVFRRLRVWRESRVKTGPLSPLAVRGADGFTIAEATLATAVVGMGFLAVFNTNAYQLKLVKKTRETNAASLALQERVETMRISNWRQMTNASYVAGTLMLKPTQSSGPLSGLEESITVSAYPDPSVCEPLTVVRNASGTHTPPSGGVGLSDQRIARVDLSVSWLGSNGQTFQRSSSTLISNSGISRLNLANNSTSTDTTSTDTTSTDTTSTDTTGTGTTGTGTGSPNGNGNGNGNSNANSNPHGNTGGKNGKG